MKTLSHSIKVLGVLLLMAGGAEAHSIVNTIVNSPLSVAGTVRDARVGINVYLQSEAAPGIEFMDPNVVGYGIPTGARGQELKSPLVDGKLALSHPADEVSPKVGKRFGGAVMSLAFTAGNKPGKYRPTLALLSDPGDIASENGSRYTYTIVVK